MNKDRRAKLELIRESLDALMVELEMLRDEEQEYYDNMPESFQNGDKGEAADTAIYALSSAYDDVSSAIENVEGAIG